MNKICIVGRIADHCTKEKEVKIGNCCLYTTYIDCRRESGTIDRLKLVFKQKPFISEGARVEISGSVCSYNRICPDQNGKLILFILVEDIIQTDAADSNMVILDGFICKKADMRCTPFGRVITDFVIAVNTTRKHSDYINCIAWGKMAKWANMQRIGASVVVTGRMQSREYIKVVDGKEHIMTAYEISVISL